MQNDMQCFLVKFMLFIMHPFLYAGLQHITVKVGNLSIYYFVMLPFFLTTLKISFGTKDTNQWFPDVILPNLFCKHIGVQ